MQTVDQKPILFTSEQYHETGSGNRLGKKALIRNADKIKINGKTTISDHCIIRADLGSITMGQYVMIEEKCILKPPLKKGLE
jgi:carbonic anhydrase/acetyltransferase-like protein (isoleucine patch superfamily)